MKAGQSESIRRTPSLCAGRWVKWQRHMNQILKKFDDDKCNGDTSGARQFSEKPYPDFDWGEFKRRCRDAIQQSLRDGPPRLSGPLPGVPEGVPEGLPVFEVP
jgi:hypothetical protein